MSNTTEREELFNSLISLKHNIQSIAGIVQNPITVSAEELNEWNAEVNSIIRELHETKIEVNEFYMREINNRK